MKTGNSVFMSESVQFQVRMSMLNINVHSTTQQAIESEEHIAGSQWSHSSNMSIIDVGNYGEGIIL